MSEWPPIDEPELLRRMTMGDEEFAAFIRGVIARLAPRLYDPALLALALGYPWTRPAGSYLLSGGEVDLLADLDSGDRKGILDRFTASAGGRLPVLSIGSNAAPEVLRRKFAHLAGEEDRAVLALSGRLHDFDVGVAAQPTMYGALPATLFPSPGTAAAATLLWVTPAQFTQLAWSEITYRLGRLHSRFDVDEPARAFDEVLVFVSRFGVFCPDGEPVALAPVPATRRTAPERTQEQLLNAAALLALGPKASAETLVHAIFEEPAATVTRIAATVHNAALPFASERWAPFG